MPLFSRKTPKPNPKVIIEGIEVEFLRDFETWVIKYRGTDFFPSGQPLTLTVPSKTLLDSIADTLDFLRPEMRERVQKELARWKDKKVDDGESYSVALEDVESEKAFIVSCSDGASWGDLAVDFTIKDRIIVEEAWGD